MVLQGVVAEAFDNREGDLSEREVGSCYRLPLKSRAQYGKRIGGPQRSHGWTQESSCRTP